MASEIFAKEEIPSGVETDVKEIFRLSERRESLQTRWSKLFEKEENLRERYSQDVQFDENKKFKSDFSFLESGDRKKFEETEKEMRSIEKERDEIDKEILRMRFGVGLKYLEELLRRDDIQWRLVEDFSSDFRNNPHGEMRVKKWLAKIGDDIVEVEFSAGRPVSFKEGIKKAAEEIGGVELLQRMGKWSDRRKIPFQGYRFSFLCGSKKIRRLDRHFWPGLALSKRYDSQSEEGDRAEVELPSSQGARAFPQISNAENERAKRMLIQLQNKLKIENI